MLCDVIIQRITNFCPLMLSDVLYNIEPVSDRRCCMMLYRVLYIQHLTTFLFILVTADVVYMLYDTFNQFLTADVVYMFRH